MAEPIRISMRVPGTSPMPELLNMIRQIEEAGFDGAGILDSQMICRDTFVTMGLAASATSTLRLFPAVTNPFGAHSIGAGGGGADGGRDCPGTDQVHHRHRLYLGKHLSGGVRRLCGRCGRALPK